jgi:hypothetical protein
LNPSPKTVDAGINPASGLHPKPFAVVAAPCWQSGVCHADCFRERPDDQFVPSVLPARIVSQRVHIPYTVDEVVAVSPYAIEGQVFDGPPLPGKLAIRRHMYLNNRALFDRHTKRSHTGADRIRVLPSCLTAELMEPLRCTPPAGPFSPLPPPRLPYKPGSDPPTAAFASARSAVAGAHRTTSAR